MEIGNAELVITEVELLIDCDDCDSTGLLPNDEAESIDDPPYKPCPRCAEARAEKGETDARD